MKDLDTSRLMNMHIVMPDCKMVYECTRERSIGRTSPPLVEDFEKKPI